MHLKVGNSLVEMDSLNKEEADCYEKLSNEMNAFLEEFMQWDMNTDAGGFLEAAERRLAPIIGNNNEVKEKPVENEIKEELVENEIIEMGVEKSEIEIEEFIENRKIEKFESANFDTNLS